MPYLYMIVTVFAVFVLKKKQSQVVWSLFGLFSQTANTANTVDTYDCLCFILLGWNEENALHAHKYNRIKRAYIFALVNTYQRWYIQSINTKYLQRVQHNLGGKWNDHINHVHRTHRPNTHKHVTWSLAVDCYDFYGYYVHYVCHSRHSFQSTRIESIQFDWF